MDKRLLEFFEQYMNSLKAAAPAYGDLSGRNFPGVCRIAVLSNDYRVEHPHYGGDDAAI
jgi:hypothetical protein